MLRLEEELTDFYRLCEEEPALRHVVEEGKGRVLRSPTVYEDVVMVTYYGSDMTQEEVAEIIWD